jgi:uncharacterized protein (TIGR03032 family)
MFQLKGRSILLRQTIPEDAPVLFRAYRDKAFLRLFAAHRKVPTSEAELRRSLQKRTQISPASLRYIEWLIVHKRHGAIGLAALNNYSQKHGRAEYLIGLFNNKHCHLGYGIEATLLVLDFAFNHLKLNKIQSFVYDYNPIARQVLLKGDFKPEGIQPNHHYATQEWVSLYCFGLSVDDFRQSQVLGRLFRNRLKISPNPLSNEENYQDAERMSNAQFSANKSATSRPTTPTSPAQALPPFSCSHTPEFPDILAQLGCTLVLSSYQAGKVILLSARADGLIQLPRTFNKPMGLAVEEQRLAVATQEEVVVLANAADLAATYPKQPNTYDSLLIPQATYYSGELDIHEMAWGREGLWAVNTRFSCLSLIDDKYSFTPRWLPPFIKALTADDCCHLNGFALQAGKPRYVTALGNSERAKGWRPNKLNGGLLIDVQTGETLLSGLAMPHSPRLYDDVLYLLNSARGELLQVDLKSGQTQIINQLPCFARGMARCGDYLFIGLSKLRRQHNTIGDLPIADKPSFCGVVVLHLPSGQIVGSVRYLTTCDEIYDVQILPNLRRPGIIGVGNAMHRHALATPTGCFWNNMESKL